MIKKKVRKQRHLLHDTQTATQLKHISSGHFSPTKIFTTTNFFITQFAEINQDSMSKRHQNTPNIKNTGRKIANFSFISPNI